MTEFISSDNKTKVIALLEQINNAINDLKEWNKDVLSVDDYYMTPSGMKNLAASCMLVEAIGEGYKRIDKLTNSLLLPERSEIPWHEVIGIRNHIAHGYFDIDGEVVLNTIKNDLDSIKAANDYFLNKLK